MRDDRPALPGSMRLLQAAAFVSGFDRFVMPPLLLTMAVTLDVSLATMVQVAGVYFLAYGLMQPVWGAVTDSFGLVRTMRATLLVASLASIATAAANSAGAVAVSRGLAGAFFASVYPSILILLGDTVPAPQRHRAVARLMVGVAGGTATASVLAGVLADVVSWRAAFVATGVAGLLISWLLRSVAEPQVVRSHRSFLAPIARVLTSRVGLLVLALAFVEGMVLLGMLTLLPSAVESAGSTAAMAGSVAGIYGFAVLASALLVGRLSTRLHPAWLIALGAAATLVGALLLTASQRPAVAACVAVLLGLGWASMHTSLQTWGTELIPDVRATVVSLSAGCLFLGSSAATALVAGLADAGRFSVIFALAGGLCIPLGVAATYGRARWVGPDHRSS